MKFSRASKEDRKIKDLRDQLLVNRIEYEHAVKRAEYHKKVVDMLSARLDEIERSQLEKV